MGLFIAFETLYLRIPRYKRGREGREGSYFFINVYVNIALLLCNCIV
jgi:hypothetical protein